MKKMNKKLMCTILVILLTLIIIVLMLFVNKSDNKDEAKVVNHKDSKVKEEHDYDLAVDKKEKNDITTEANKLSDELNAIYIKICGEGDVEPVFTDKQEKEYIKKLAGDDRPVYNTSQNKNMVNYKLMQNYIKSVDNKKKADIIVYNVQSDGSISRLKFEYDGDNMYLTNASMCWNKDKLVVTSILKMKLVRWSYTKKGWFSYEVCVKETPDMTETINGNAMIRVLPVKQEYLDISNRYLAPISYQGNNLFFVNWDKNNMKNIDFNGLYEYLYRIEHSKRYAGADNENGIKASDFTKLMCKYLPIDEEALKKYADYDKKSGYYMWEEFGCLNYIPEAFGTSTPEITDIKKNDDGTMKLTVDAVCTFTGDDCVMTHELVVKIDDGKIRFISNHVSDEDLKKIPEYMYRCHR